MDTLIKTSITALNKPNNNNQPQQDSSETVVHIPSPRWGGWDLKNVLLIGSIAHNKCAKIITKIRNNPDLALRLLGWLIYGYENRQGTDQAQGINSPVLFAVSRYLHNEPAPVYLSIAGESPRTLMTYLQNHFSPDIPSEWQRVFRALKKNGFSNLLETQIGTEYADSADEVINPLPGRETSIAPVGEDPPEWASHPQAELPRSAEELWNGIKAVARIPPDFPPVSMWLNGRELAVSFANPAAYHQAKELLEKSRGAIAENYPNYSICLRLLQLSPKSRPESPQVDIIAEHRTVTP